MAGNFIRKHEKGNAPKKLRIIRDFEKKTSVFSKDNQMRSPSLLSGPKFRKAYLEASNQKMLLHRPH